MAGLQDAYIVALLNDKRSHLASHAASERAFELPGRRTTRRGSRPEDVDSRFRSTRTRLDSEARPLPIEDGYAQPVARPYSLSKVKYNPQWPGLLLQPESREISQEQPAAEVKSIYTGLTMVETKCIYIDKAQAATPKSESKITNEHWQAMIALHLTLLHQHHDFFLASQHPSASPALKRLALRYSMPARMWKHGIHSFLELLRHRLSESLEYQLAFIYLAYQMMALLYETVDTFRTTWTECLGDLGRYRRAMEDEDVRDRETRISPVLKVSILVHRPSSVGRVVFHGHQAHLQEQRWVIDDALRNAFSKVSSVALVELGTARYIRHRIPPVARSLMSFIEAAPWTICSFLDWLALPILSALAMTKTIARRVAKLRRSQTSTVLSLFSVISQTLPVVTADVFTQQSDKTIPTADPPKAAIWIPLCIALSLNTLYAMVTCFREDSFFPLSRILAGTIDVVVLAITADTTGTFDPHLELPLYISAFCTTAVYVYIENLRSDHRAQNAQTNAEEVALAHSKVSREEKFWIIFIVITAVTLAILMPWYIFGNGSCTAALPFAAWVGALSCAYGI